MKVLQVIDTLNVGGAERIIVTLSNLLYNKGISVSVLLLVEEGGLLKSLNPNIKVYKLKRKNKYSVRKMKILADIIAEFSIVHVHLKHNYRYVKLVSNLFVKKKIILHDHSHNLYISKGFVRKFKDSFFKTLLKPDLYIGVSQENCNWAENVLKLKSSKIHKLSNIIIKENYIYNEEKRDIILVSNILRIKNLSFALKIVKNLNFNLHIYGNVYDRIYLKELEKEMEELDIKNKVKIISNVTNIQQVLPKYKFALLTSIKETGPLVIIEYLAQSIPFLAYKTGDVVSLIEKDLPLHIINNFDENKWIERINKIINSPITNLETVYYKYFNPNNYLEECLKIYKKIVNS